MANDRGLLRIDEIPAFKNYCNLVSVGYADGRGEFEALRVFYNMNTHVITRNSKDVLATPPGMRSLIDNFRAQHNVYNDSVRLEFMLSKGRKVIVENMCNGDHEVYVEEGTMGDKKYPSVLAQNSSDMSWTSKEALALKRQAIDLAIANQ